MAADRAVLSCYDKACGQLRQTTDVTNDLLDDAERSDSTQPALAALDKAVAVALGNRLVLVHGDGRPLRVELPGQVVRVLATLPYSRQGVAVMLQNGAVMYWVGSTACVELDRDLPSPLGAFIPGGPLVLASGTQILLLDMDSRGVHQVTRLESAGQRIVAVSAAANPGEFAVLGEQGEMTVYRI